MTEPTIDLSKTPTDSKPRTLPKRIGWVQRIVFGACGLLLVVGFFLPWVIAGTALELSGLGLVFSGGDVVQAISGSGRFLLFLVPLLGASLVVGALTGHRITPWIGALGAGALLLFGVIHVIMLFVSSTGPGMWMVVFSSFVALILGALTIGGAPRKE